MPQKSLVSLISTTMSLFLSLFVTTKTSKAKKSIENRYGKALTKFGKKHINIRKIKHSIKNFRFFLTFSLTFAEVQTFFS